MIRFRDGSSHTHESPVIPANKSVPEITIAAVILGIFLSIVMGAANTYLGLYAGMTVSASIPAAVISMAILRGVLRRGSILENNIVQTMASTGESLAAGVIFTVPALVLVGAWQDFRFWPTTLIVLLGGILGIILMVPMRRALIVDRSDLIYPEGVACAEVLVAGEEGGSGFKAILLGLGIGAGFKFLVSGVHAVAATVEGAAAVGRRALYFGSDMSLALMAVGYIVNIHISLLIFLGGAIGWLIAIPLMGGVEPEASALGTAWDLWSGQVRYIGVGAMLVGGVYSIWTVRRGLAAGVTGLRAVRPASGGRDVRPRTQEDMPMAHLLILFLLTVFGTFIFYDHMVGSAQIAGVTTVIMIIAAFLFVAVATYIAGLVGSSNSPVSGMTICALLLAAGVLMALGIKGESAILATLGVAGVVCCATCTSGDVAQDLKTGLLVGATPKKQQWMEIVAAVAPAFFFAPILTLLHHAYGIGTDAPGSLRAPQAALFASLANGFFGGGTLPWPMIRLGGVIGVGIIVLDRLLERSGSTFRLHIMPLAVGLYLPFSLSIPIMIGGAMRSLLDRREAKAALPTDPPHSWDDSRAAQRGASDNAAAKTHDRGILFGSGIIAGEAIFGILLAIPLTLVPGLLPDLGEPIWVSIPVFLVATAAYWIVASRRRS